MLNTKNNSKLTHYTLKIIIANTKYIKLKKISSVHYWQLFNLSNLFDPNICHVHPVMTSNAKD